MSSPFHIAAQKAKSPFHEAQLKREQEKEDLESTSLVKFGKAAIRGLGRAAAHVLERSAEVQEESSLPALLGMKPDVSLERNVASTIREAVPRESTQALPNIVSKGVETASDPASWIGGPGTAFAMGATGEALKEAGAPKWAQVAGELAVGLFKPGAKKTYTDKSPEIQIARQVMKEQGLAENEIVLATNAMKEKGFLEKAAKMTKQAEKQFESTGANLEKGVQNIISESFPGFEKGIEVVHKEASKLFEPVNKNAKNLVIGRTEKFEKAADNIIADISNNLANTPDEKAFIKMLQDAKEVAKSGKTGDAFVNFYQTLGRIGKWVDPGKKERYLTEAKDAIKSMFRDNGPLGNKLANEFEIANEGWVKFKDAEEVHDILKHSFVDERLDFTKFRKSLSNENNYNSLKNALGKESAARVKLMSEIGERVEKMAKSIEGGAYKNLIPFGKLGALAKGIISLDPILLAKSGLVLGGVDAARRLATQLLINPKYQNLWLRIMNQLEKGNTSRAVVLSKELLSMANNDPKITQSKPETPESLKY